MYEIEQDGTEKRTKGGLNSLGSAFLSFSKISHFNQALTFHPLLTRTSGHVSTFCESINALLSSDCSTIVDVKP